MSALTIRLPDSLHRKIRDLAKEEGISLNQFMATAAAEKMAALMTIDYLKSEAALASREDFDSFLAAVPISEPLPEDRLD
jgi:hypothetical protein